ncbi:MAG: 5'-nucleotidase [Bacteroidota bacterium]
MKSRIHFNVSSGLVYFFILIISCTTPVEYNLSFSSAAVEIDSTVGSLDNIENIIIPFRERLDSTMNEVIGYAAHDLTTKGKYESSLGTFVTRLLREQSISSFETEVDVAIMNHHGGLRAAINEGPITLGEVYQVMPFENEMVLLEIPGDSLTRVIEFISQSGRSMIWPVSFNVTEAGVDNILVDNKTIDPQRNYTLSISDYLANGGSGFNMLMSLNRIDVAPVKLRDMIELEIRQRTSRGDSIKAKVLNLITVDSI